ncbi:ABC transporter ATP-binding protein [Treponema phagedenis]|uniref:Leucine/isoleucine/valine transporter subunit ATP-binding component of ABC superfamily n=2 Tax=Treponema phagedenis TaxID=162 RepID=A0A0B7GW57_TREPH|nr:ABC transporter ATP-binding protein [Treponema phagedenis]CEM62904.1 leucine/isoleucine/valine transporter subunit; ATP-binding component of ABC superfamily [Treponema phagedenis]
MPFFFVKKQTEKEYSGRISPTLLEADSLSMIFGGLCAVSNFSCVLNRNELVGLIGPNGAGKTTVFNMLSGIYAPTSGTITYYDRQASRSMMQGKQPWHHAKLGIARTFQNIRLFNNLTVEDNILIALNNEKRSTVTDAVFRMGNFYADDTALRKRARELLRLLSLEDKINDYAKNLSYGEQRRLEIARALAVRPQLLLLDEPAAGMNPQETSELMEIISFIKKEFQLTVLLIEHDMKLVMGICERIIVLDYGKVIAAGSPEEVVHNPQVIKAYLGSEDSLYD